MPAIVNNLLLWAVSLIACMCWNSFDKLSVCLYVYSYFEKGCRKNVHSTIPKGNMGYDQYTVPHTAAVEPTFFAFLQHSQIYIHGLSWFHSFKFLWRTVNLKPPTIPFGIVACTFSDNLSRNSCILNGCNCSNKTAISSDHEINIFWIRKILFRCLKVQLRGNIAHRKYRNIVVSIVCSFCSMSLLWQIVCVSHGTITKSILRGLLMISPRHFIFLRPRQMNVCSENVSRRSETTKG